jgi:hypothetical protein
MERNLRETSRRFALSAFKRRWWVIPLAILATAAAGYGVASIKKETYTASSWVIADANTGSRGPGRAFDASRLALSYASSLSEDDQLINYIARSIDKPRDEVDDNFSTLNQTDTSVLRLRYSDEDRDVATLAARAAAEGAVGSQPVATSVTPGTLALVKLASEPEKSSNILALGAGVGALLGLGLGFILMLAWERADPRLDDPADVQALTGIPATRVDDLTPNRAAALLERWLTLADRADARIAVVPTSKTEGIVDQVASWLYGLHLDGPELAPPTTNGTGPEQDTVQTEAYAQPPAEQPQEEEAGGWRSRWHRPATAPEQAPFDPLRDLETQTPTVVAPERRQTDQPDAIPHGERITLVAGGPGGSATAPEVEALRSDLIVMLVQSGAKSREVLDLVNTLEQFGRRPAWTMMIDSQRKVGKRMSQAQSSGVSLKSAQQ